MTNKFRNVRSATGTTYYVNADYVVALRLAHDQYPPKLFVADLGSSGGRGEIELTTIEADEIQQWLATQQ